MLYSAFLRRQDQKNQRKDHHIDSVIQRAKVLDNSQSAEENRNDCDVGFVHVIPISV